MDRPGYRNVQRVARFPFGIHTVAEVFLVYEDPELLVFCIADIPRENDLHNPVTNALLVMGQECSRLAPG